MPNGKSQSGKRRNPSGPLARTKDCRGWVPVVTTQSTSLINVQGLTKRYRRRLAVDGVDLQVERGEVYGLIGPDGSGKSSLMKAVAGVLSFDTGRVDVFGVSLDSESAAERIKDRVGLMPQGLGLNLYPELSVEENIDFFARLRLVPDDELDRRKRKLLAMTRLDKFRDRAMKNLSGGMKQKLGLVCTLIHEPELVVLDEPTTGVDPVSRRDFWAILAELLGEKGITALVSTAYMDEASRFDRISLMFDGRVIARGEPGEIEALARGSVVAVRSQDQVAALARLKDKFGQIETLGPIVKAFVDNVDRETAIRQVSEALAGVECEELFASDPELEDVFVALLRSRELADVAGSAAPSSPGMGALPGEHGVAIEAMDLTKEFGQFRAVDRVSFRVPQGEIFGLLGANGAGKTTAIKMLTGILTPTAGTGRVAGADVRHSSRSIKQRIGYMSQAFSLYVELTVLENIHLYAGIYGLGSKETKVRTEWVIGMAGLAGHENDRASALPMGLRQRLALGCALVHRPQVLFLDEPTSGVDPIGRRHFWDILFRLSREDGVAILVTTHYMSEAEHCDHLALMYAGRIVADASPEQMKQDIEAEVGRLLEIAVDEPRRAMARLKSNGFEAALFGKRIHVLSKRPEQDQRRIEDILTTDGLRPTHVAPRPLSMEDVFVARVTALEGQELSAQKAAWMPAPAATRGDRR